MVQLNTILKSADNSGAHALKVIGIPHFSKKKVAGTGLTVKCTVRGADPTGVVKDGEIVDVVVVRTRKEHRRSDGSAIRFDDNAGVVIDKQGIPRGTRIFGPIAREVREKGFSKIISLAKEVV
ncbi:50S ribosomal protein L14 [Candidatus Microgenomates bacterium]|nr:50S ribosomal protein L14 [Candidatus Microgenomates bacterium]